MPGIGEYNLEKSGKGREGLKPKVMAGHAFAAK